LIFVANPLSLLEIFLPVEKLAMKKSATICCELFRTNNSRPKDAGDYTITLSPECSQFPASPGGMEVLTANR
jgi:hypothetical protein